jgi:hypothetical protein
MSSGYVEWKSDTAWDQTELGTEGVRDWLYLMALARRSAPPLVAIRPKWESDSENGRGARGVGLWDGWNMLDKGGFSASSRCSHRTHVERVGECEAPATCEAVVRCGRRTYLARGLLSAHSSCSPTSIARAELQPL